MAPKSSDLFPSDVDLTFSLNRLFDEYNLDHIPDEKRLELFKKRDLKLTKHYKAALKTFGNPAQRKRIFIAPPMETPLKHKLGLYTEKKDFPPCPQINTYMEPRQTEVKPPISGSALKELKEQDTLNSYKTWLQERRKFRQDFDHLGLSENWLLHKPSRTVIEECIFQKYEDLHFPEVAPEEPEDPDTQSCVRSLILPAISIPNTGALAKLDKHLRMNRLRLYDIFVMADQDKDWQLTKEEILHAFDQLNIPISPTELEEMITSLDLDMDKSISYHEFAAGMTVWRRRLEVRDSFDAKSKVGERIVQTRRRALLKLSTFHSGGRANLQECTKPKVVFNTDYDTYKQLISYCEEHEKTPEEEEEEVIPEEKASSENNLLSPPEIELNEEFLPQTSESYVDLCKMTADILHNYRESAKEYYATLKNLFADKATKNTKPKRPAVIRSGIKAVDNHCQWSTLSGQMGIAVNSFRQRALQQYFAILKKCKTMGILLTRKLWERVMLYPPDRPTQDILSSIDRSTKDRQLHSARSVGKKQKAMKKEDHLPMSEADASVTHVGSSSLFPPKERAVTISDTANHSRSVSVHYQLGLAGTDSDVSIGTRSSGIYAMRRNTNRSGRGQVGCSSNANKLICKNMLYSNLPHRDSVDRGETVNLSTGTAHITPAIDTWLTFEDFLEITGRMNRGYHQLTRSTDNNAFWPGHLLDKLALVKDGSAGESRGNAVFHHTGQSKSPYGYRSGLNAWPMNDDGYIQNGRYDPYRNKIKSYM